MIPIGFLRDGQASQGHLVGDVLLHDFWVTPHRLEIARWLPKHASPVETNVKPVGQSPPHKCGKMHVGVMVQE